MSGFAPLELTGDLAGEHFAVFYREPPDRRTGFEVELGQQDPEGVGSVAEWE